MAVDKNATRSVQTESINVSLNVISQMNDQMFLVMLRSKSCVTVGTDT